MTNALGFLAVALVRYAGDRGDADRSLRRQHLFGLSGIGVEAAADEHVF
ncbi:hypothetical protein ACFC18_43775 [Streptomyces sp. NPDC056121]